MARRDASQARPGYRRTLIIHLRRLIGLLLLGLLVGSGGARGTDDPAVHSGLIWLDAQLQGDGSIAGAADIAAPPQATAEALRTLARLAPDTAPDTATVIAYSPSPMPTTARSLRPPAWPRARASTSATWP